MGAVFLDVINKHMKRISKRIERLGESKRWTFQLPTTRQSLEKNVKSSMNFTQCGFELEMKFHDL